MMVIPVEINGTLGTMALDLANTSGRLTPTAVGQLKLAVHDSATTFHIIDGKRQPIQFASFSSLKVGGVPIARGQLQVLSFPTDPAEMVFGNITTDILRNVDFEIDPMHKALRLYSQDSCPDGVVYWTKHYSSARLYKNQFGGLILPMTLEDKPIEARLLTTSRNSNLMTDASQFLFGFDEHSPGNELKLDASGQESAYFRAMKLTAQGLDATNVNIRLIPGSKRCKLRVNGGPANAAGYDGCPGLSPLVVGTGILEKLRMYFALKEGVLYFSAAEAGDNAVLPPTAAPEGASTH